MQGIEEAARAAGYVVSIAVVESDRPRDLDRAVDLVLSQSLAGAIVVEFDSLGIRTLESLPRRCRSSRLRVPAPSKCATPRLPRRPVRGAEATRHLLSLGHRTVHHVAIPSTRPRSGRTWVGGAPSRRRVWRGQRWCRQATTPTRATRPGSLSPTTRR
ncbi:hypothetical protein NKG05_04945 [Oerskovia sp. M15]